MCQRCVIRFRLRGFGCCLQGYDHACQGQGQVIRIRIMRFTLCIIKQYIYIYTHMTNVGQGAMSYTGLHTCAVSRADVA